MQREINPYAKQLFLDVQTRTRFASDSLNTDVLVKASSGNPTLDQEDRRPLAGTDAVAGTTDGYNNWFKAQGNRLEGRDGNILSNARFNSITRRGNRVDTHTTFDRFVWRDTVTKGRATNADSARDQTFKGWN